MNKDEIYENIGQITHPLLLELLPTRLSPSMSLFCEGRNVDMNGRGCVMVKTVFNFIS